MIYVIAGEVSGDLHAAHLISQLKERNNKLTFRGMGGEQLKKQGVELAFSYKEIAIMGFWEVLKKRKQLKKVMAEVVKDIVHSDPEKLLLVDSSGFNLRIAKAVRKKSNIEIHYYIAPKIWAWAEWRIKKIKERVDYLWCILPFEEQYFRKKGFDNAHYVGNPTMQEIEQHSFQTLSEIDLTKPLLVLLPGSRKQEVERILPVMLDVAKRFKDYQSVIAKAPGLTFDFYRTIDPSLKRNQVIEDKTWDLLKLASKSIVTSGTATLETALIGCPQVVVYKTSSLSYFLGKRLVKIKFISLVNLILNKPVVTELIQAEANVNLITSALRQCSSTASNEIKGQLEDVLGAGNVSIMFDHLGSKKGLL